MIKKMLGTIRGRTIEIAEDLGLADGQEVEVTVCAASPTENRTGEGFLRTEGALADDPYWDAIMEQVHQERKRDGRKIPEDQ